MSDSSLPVEILELIFRYLISDYTRVIAESELLPRWYLLPLLRVCKLWHLVGERYLYRSISIGLSFKHLRYELRGLPAPPILVKRDPSMIYDELLHTLKANYRLATLVEELQMGSSSELRSTANPQLVDICPNLRHVNIRKIHPSEIDNLFKVLEDKRLASFRFTGFKAHTVLPIFDLMQRWPHIQTIAVTGENLRLKGHSQASGALNCCSELREIILRGYTCLRENDFACLRLMCSVVTKLLGSVQYSDTKALDAFCECLHAWSPTMECLNVHVWPTTSSYHPLSDAMSSLTSLQELDLHDFSVDFGAISSLPLLQRLIYTCSHPNSAVDRLASLLEDPEKFAAVIDIKLSVFGGHGESRGEILQDVCHRRNIALLIRIIGSFRVY